MPIEQVPTLTVMPYWLPCKADRYVSHPALRTAMIQLVAEPDHLFIITDQTLPQSMSHARAIIENWRTQNATAEE